MQATLNFTMPIAIGADHAGYEMKEYIISYLEGKDLTYKDFGTHSSHPADYPDVAHPVAQAVSSGQCGCAVLLCGSGNGVGMAANKHAGVRAAICWDDEIAALSRRHNNANIICIPARFVSEATAEGMLDVFLNTTFEGDRHTNRVNKIDC